MSINPSDVAKLMQNLNMNAAKSTSMTTGVGSMRKSSFNYSRRSNGQDDSDEDEANATTPACTTDELAAQIRNLRI